MAQAARWLQFSKVGTSTHPTLVDKSEKHENRTIQRGKKLSYVPPSSKEGKLIVNIEAYDLKEQEKYWKIAIIGYVIGNTPYLKAMKSYISQAWSFAQKPQVLLHNEGYFIFRFNSMEDCEGWSRLAHTHSTTSPFTSWLPGEFHLQTWLNY